MCTSTDVKLLFIITLGHTTTNVISNIILQLFCLLVQ